MYTLCTTERSAAQQRDFEATFLKLLLENLYDDITISGLCEEAGLSLRCHGIFKICRRGVSLNVIHGNYGYVER